jgi:tetratricopeptide (TPR) repeat protein
MELKIISVLFGILLVSALIGISAGEDCGCGGFDTSAPSLPSDGGNAASESFYSGLDSSPGGSSSGGTSSGSSSSESSSSGSGSQTSGSSVSGDSGSGGAGSGSTSSDNAALLASKGLDLYKKGDFNNSLIALNSSLDNDPYTPKTWIMKGDVLTSLGRYDEAIAAYKKVIKLDPADPMAYVKIGDALVNEGKFSEAVVSYDHALAANPGLTWVQANRTRAVDLASGLIKANLTDTVPVVTTTAPTPLPSFSTDISPVMSVTSPSSTTKAPLSFIILLMIVPIMGLVSTIFQRKK